MAQNSNGKGKNSSSSPGCKQSKKRDKAFSFHSHLRYFPKLMLNIQRNRIIDVFCRVHSRFNARRNEKRRYFDLKQHSTATTKRKKNREKKLYRRSYI